MRMPRKRIRPIVTKEEPKKREAIHAGAGPVILEMKSTAHPCPVVVEIQREALKAKYRSWTLASRSDSKRRSECGEVKNDHHQKTGARRGVGSVLTYQVFPGNKAGRDTHSHRKPYKPKSNRATSSKNRPASFRAAHFLAPKAKV
jgi:hypothetical protein